MTFRFLFHRAGRRRRGLIDMAGLLWNKNSFGFRVEIFFFFGFSSTAQESDGKYGKNLFEEDHFLYWHDEIKNQNEEPSFGTIIILKQLMPECIIVEYNSLL